MLLNVDFVVVFLGFMNRYYLNKRFLSNICNNNLLHTSLVLFNKKEFFVLFIYIINIIKINMSFNINKYFIKDYRFFYILEFYLKYKNLFIKKWFFFLYN